MDNTPQSSCVSPAATTISAGESSWAMHIANFLASPHSREELVDQEASYDSSFSTGFPSSFGDDASFITSELMCEDDNEEDDSLQDTACSSSAGTKATSMSSVDTKSMVSMDAKDIHIPELAKYLADIGSRQQATNTVKEVISGDYSNEKALYESNELRKKGLCLVPLSMLINYLG